MSSLQGRSRDPEGGNRLCQDFPDGLWPTTTEGLSGRSNAHAVISKHLICSMEGVSGGCQAVILAETPCVGVSIGDLREPSLLRCLVASLDALGFDACGCSTR
jgi:hypothetical protein